MTSVETKKVPWALTPAGVAAVTVLFSIPAKVLSERLIDPDLWWHLKTGAIIAGTHSIPHRDVFSYSVPGKPWVVQEWGAELILHGIQKAFGLWGIFFWRALMLLIVYALVSRLLVRRMGTGIGTWVVLALVAYGGAANWTERPNLFSFLLFVVTLDLLDRHDRSRIWWFVPLAAVWANLHGMVIIGIGLVGLVALAESIKAGLGRAGADAAWAQRLWVVTVAGFLATLLNPRGPALLVHSYRLIRVVGSLVTEWASPSFHELTSIIFLVLLLVTIVVLAIRRDEIDLTDLALALAFTVLALQAARNLALAAIVLGYVVSGSAAAAGAALRRGDGKPSGVRAAQSAAIGIAGLIIAIGALSIHVARNFPSNDTPGGIVDREYPVATLASLDKPGTRVFALDFWAGYLIDQSWPGVHVYQDTRDDMYGADQTRRYARAIAGLPGWQQTLDASCTTHVVVRPNRDPIAEELRVSPDWKIVRENDVAIVFVRRSAATGCEQYPIPQ